MKEKKLGLGSVIATGVGLVVASSCLLSIGIGTSAIGITFIISMVVACILNIVTLLSIAELNALMPDLTGGLAQYSLACVGQFITILCMVGGYALCNTIAGSVEGAMFGNTIASLLPGVSVPGWVYCVILVVLLMIANLNGVDVFIKIQDFVAYALIASLVIMGVMGALGIGTGEIVEQPAVIASDFSSITGLCGLAFFLFIGGEYVVPLTKEVKNAKRDIPLGMILSMLIILAMQIFLTLGFKNYTSWEELGASTTPHILFGRMLLGSFGRYWMVIVSLLAVISSVNTVMSSLSYILLGMAKIGLLPSVFNKTNKKNAPYVGIIFEAAAFCIINITGLSTTDSLSFLISVLAILWMLSYVVSNLNVLLLRKRLPNAPRNFKVPLGPVFPVVGIFGTIWMIYNIDPDLSVKLSLYKVCGVIILALTLYAFFWLKFQVKRPFFKPYPVKEVMAMENELYEKYHRPKKKKESGSEREQSRAS